VLHFEEETRVSEGVKRGDDSGSRSLKAAEAGKGRGGSSCGASRLQVGRGPARR
jgi:hypothetical protein